MIDVERETCQLQTKQAYMVVPWFSLVFKLLPHFDWLKKPYRPFTTIFIFSLSSVAKNYRQKHTHINMKQYHQSSNFMVVWNDMEFCFLYRMKKLLYITNLFQNYEDKNLAVYSSLRNNRCYITHRLTLRDKLARKI